MYKGTRFLQVSAEAVSYFYDWVNWNTYLDLREHCSQVVVLDMAVVEGVVTVAWLMTVGLSLVQSNPRH